MLKEIIFPEKIIAPTLSGERIISESQLWSDSCFNNWGLNERGKQTPETELLVFRLSGSGKLREIFESFGKNLNQLKLSQDQIISFSQKYLHDLLRREEDASAFFLFENKGKFFFVGICIDEANDNLEAYAYKFSDCHVWQEKCNHYIVILKPLI